MALVKGPIRITWLKQFLLWAKTVFDEAAMAFIGVDLDQIDKVAPRRVKSAPGQPRPQGFSLKKWVGIF